MVKVLIDNGVEKHRVTPVEDAFNLNSIVSISLFNRTVGAYLLKKGKNSFKIKFGFNCQGIHPVMRNELVEPTFELLDAGLKDIPLNEELTLHLSSFLDIKARTKELKELVSSSQWASLQYLLMSNIQRLQELQKVGLRKNCQLTIYCTYTVSEDNLKEPFKKTLALLEQIWKGFTGALPIEEEQQLTDLLKRAFCDGFLVWEQLLTNKMGLIVTPLSSNELWGLLWQRFNSSTPLPIPSLLVLDEDGLSWVGHSQLHPVSILMSSDETSVPVADRRWVWVKENYIGVGTIAEKPAGWNDTISQLRYIWDAISDDQVVDTEVIVQIVSANQSLLHQRMQSLTKQAKVAEIEATTKQTVNVNASLKKELAISAQKELYSGAVCFRTANVFLVHRKTLAQLDSALKYLSSKFRRPAWFIRESEYAWKIWLETFPIYWGRLMAKPFERRQTYLSSELPGLMPLLCNRSRDRTGLELLAVAHGTPVHLDLYQKLRNILVLGTNRCGKSLIVAQMLILGLANKLSVCAVDFPKPDGSGTFSFLCQLLGEEVAAYFDISNESSNLFELPDLKGMAIKVQNEKLNDYKESLAEILLMMVKGQSANQSVNPDTVRSLLVLGLEKFFFDPTIRERYVNAYKDGFGSRAWSETPTLKDFESFLSLERLELISPNSETIATINHIKLRFKFWLNSRVGKAISRSSTFKSDAPFLCIALRNLSNSEDAAVIASNVYLLGLRRSLASNNSIFYLDEAPIFLEYESLASLVARHTANGAKSGLRVILTAQDPDSIANCAYSSRILQNINTRLIGKIEPTALDSYVSIFKIPLSIISPAATEKFLPNRESNYTNWLVDDGDIFTYARFFAPYGLLAAVANNNDEVKTREKLVSQYDDELLATHIYSQKFYPNKGDIKR